MVRILSFQVMLVKMMKFLQQVLSQLDSLNGCVNGSSSTFSIVFSLLSTRHSFCPQNLGYGKNAVLQRRAARRRDPKRARDSIFPLLVVSTWTCCVRHGSPLVIPLILMCPILN